MQTFTIEQAARALAYVRPICAEISEHYKRFQACRADLASPQGPRGDAREALIDDLDTAKEALIAACDELEHAGVQVKSLERRGLVDFPYRRQDGAIVLLCWRMGEAGIDHWHDMDSGFDGRQPLDTLETAEILDQAKR